MRASLLSLAIAAAAFPSGMVRAADVTWSGGVSADWNNALNWQGGVLPAAGSDLIFGAAGSSGTALTDTIAGGFVVNSLTYAGPSSFSQSGNAISLTTGIANSGTAAQSLANDIAFSGPTASLSTATGGGNLTLSGALSGGAAVTASGSGTLTIQRDTNNLTGPITVGGGTLRALASTAAGAKSTLGSGSIAVSSGATLTLATGSTSNTLSWANNITLNGGTLRNEDGQQTLNGTLNSTGSSSISGVWSGKNLTVAGATNVTGGTLTVRSVTAFSGDVNITGSGSVFSVQASPVTLSGSVVVASGNTLAVQGTNARLVFTGNLSGAGDFKLDSGSGTITYSGTSNGFTGTITCASSSGGTFTVSAGSTLATTGAFNEYAAKTHVIDGMLSTGAMTILANVTAAVAFNGTGTVNASGFTTNTTRVVTMNVADLIVGAGGTRVNAGTLLVNGVLTSTGTVTVATGATLGGSGTVNGAVTVNGTLRGGAGLVATDTLATGAGVVTLAAGSTVQLAIGASGAASRIAVGAGGIVFRNNQSFSFVDLGGAAPGTYTLITGASALENTGGWTVANAGWAGVFVNNAGTISINLTAVPEPATYGLVGAVALMACGVFRRRRDGAN